ncbi:MAG: TerB N-terminal domain-containing protein [Candidatus Sedimenticola sp. (ex Thyasira tokunagai)]
MFSPKSNYEHKESIFDAPQKRASPQNIKPRKKLAIGRWYGPEERVTVGDYIISDGMVYVGSRFPRSVDGYSMSSCLIDPTKRTRASSPDLPRDEMGYWPHYSEITPDARGGYLKWLSTGRTDINANIGLVFLFFYGIERRLFGGLDDDKPGADEQKKLTDEVQRLLTIYGENASFSRYAHQLLNTAWLVYERSESLPNNLDTSQSHNEMIIKYLVAEHCGKGRPIPVDLAIAWLHQHPERRLRTPARRCPKEFAQLFRQLYATRHGDGMIVKPNKRKLELVYTFAGSSYGGANLTFSSEDLPDPFLLTGPFRKLQAIADEATDQLDAYSRYIGKKDNDPASMDSKALLPRLLMRQDPHLIEVQQQLDGFMGNKSNHGLLSVKELYRMLGQTAPAKITKKEAITLAELIEKLGYGVAPDMRYHKPRIDPQGGIVIFQKGHGVDFHPSAEFDMMGAILRLGALIAQIDEVKFEEEVLLQSVVQDDRELTGIEKDSLAALLHWMLCSPQSTAGIKQKLAVLSEDERETISHILIAVAHADGHIDPSEIKQLEKLYTTLGLDKSQVTGDLHAYAAHNAPSGEAGLVTVATKIPELPHTIPKSQPKRRGFQINEELLKLREQETHQVKDVLAEIFTEEEEEPVVDTVTNSDVKTVSPLAQLDEAHRSLFETLITKETWERDALHALCEPMKLFVDGAMETINEWAYDQVNAPVIEDGEPVFIDIELAKEIVKA